ncbi:MAG: ABC transporter substrate-binding protein [Dehalococcoidia bacterium]
MSKLILNRLWLPILALLILAAACGGGDDDDDGDDRQTPQETATQGATPAESEEGTAFPLDLERSDGETLTIELEPQRIVSLDSSATEILYAIGAGDQVVAADLFSNYPAEAEAKARLDAFQPSAEAILNERPDLVLVFDDATGVVGTLDDLGARVLYLEVPDSLDGIYERIDLYGQITGHEQEAAELVESMTARVDTVLQTIAEVAEGPRVFHELDNTLFTISSDSFLGDLYVLLKAENIAADAADAFPQMTAEAVIEADPEVIILADEEFGEDIDTVSARPGWNVISAVQSGRVHGVNPDIASRPGPRIVDLLEQLAALLYPELFT